jgi:hypothetical protein
MEESETGWCGCWFVRLNKQDWGCYLVEKGIKGVQRRWMDLQRDWGVLQQIAACAPQLENGANER